MIPHNNSAQQFSKDNKVLTSLSLPSSTTSYKLNYGLAPHVSLNIMEEL